VEVYEEKVQTYDGVVLNYYHWVPENAKAAIVISHGWSEHAGRYNVLAEWFAEFGFEVHALDHRGHGKSQGKRGHVGQWLDYARDLEHLRLSLDPLPQYLVGHSMGGMISVLHQLEYPNSFAAVALSGPAADVSIPVSTLKTLMGKTMSYIMPQLLLANNIDPYSVCSDTKVVESYINDPFNHGTVSARWFSEYLKTIERVKREAGDIKTPLAIWHGSGDTLVAPWVSKNLFSILKMEPRQYKLVEGVFHEILLETNWMDTANEMKTWLSKF
jgi:alpha-beta hydrolase superfamily lysophospholipase